MAESLAELTVRQGVASDLRATARALDCALVGVWREPTAAEIAQALRTSTERVRLIAAGLRSDIEHVLQVIAPAVVVLAGLEAGRQISDLRLAA
jgi:hypothetical protein